MGKGTHEGAGWQLTAPNNGQLRYRIIGTSGNDDQSVSMTRNAQQLISLTFGDGSREFFSFGDQKSSISDTGSIPLLPNSAFGVGCTVNNSGVPTSTAKIRISELLIYEEKLTQDARQRIEGYLAHKWDKAASLVNGPPHKAATPSFSEPLSAAP